MPISFKTVLLVAALGLATPTLADEPPAPAHDHGPAPDQAAAPAAKGGLMPMSGMMGMGPMHCLGLSEQHLSDEKAKLALTDRQLKAWDAFAAAAKAPPHPMPADATKPMPIKPGGTPGMMGGDGMMAMMKSRPLPERLAHHETMMKAHLKAIGKVRTTVAALYRVLTPAQRDIADKRLCGGMAH